MNNMNPILHTIRPGDTLYNLSLMYDTTVDEIINNNYGIDPFNLKIGEQIYIYPPLHNSQDKWISKNQMDLLSKMNLKWLEYVFWTRLLLISIVDELEDLSFTTERLFENPKDIADIFRKYYGNNVANTIQNLLTEHLKIGSQLITALKNGNENLAKELNERWYKNADEMADAFASINPYYKKEDIRNMLYSHLKMTTDEVSSRLVKDYASDIKAYDMVQNEILKMSKFFVDGIVRQFANLF